MGFVCLDFLATALNTLADHDHREHDELDEALRDPGDIDRHRWAQPDCECRKAKKRKAGKEVRTGHSSDCASQRDCETLVEACERLLCLVGLVGILGCMRVWCVVEEGHGD